MDGTTTAKRRQGSIEKQKCLIEVTNENSDLVLQIAVNFVIELTGFQFQIENKHPEHHK